MNLWLYIIGGALIWTLGDFFMKYWLENQKWTLFGAGIFVWTIGLIFLAFSFKYKHMAVASIMMISLNSILLVALLWIFFKEQLTVTQIAGIVFCLAGLYLLEVSWLYFVQIVQGVALHTKQRTCSKECYYRNLRYKPDCLFDCLRGPPQKSWCAKLVHARCVFSANSLLETHEYFLTLF